MPDYSKFKQGVYTPIHPEKFIGNKKIRYLSSYELKFLSWCDRNLNVIKIGSECIIINYRSPIDGRVHRYYVDNVVHIREGDKIVKYLIEIKPFKQTIPPVPSKRKKKSTIIYEQVMYAVNQAKWSSAVEYCKRNGYKWQLLSEKELNIMP